MIVALGSVVKVDVEMESMHRLEFTIHFLGHQFMHKWNTIQTSRAKTPVNAQYFPDNWLSPPFGLIKCSVNVTFFFDNTSFFVGMCIRDNNGKFLSTKSFVIYGLVR